MKKFYSFILLILAVTSAPLLANTPQWLLSQEQMKTKNLQFINELKTYGLPYDSNSVAWRIGGDIIGNGANFSQNLTEFLYANIVKSLENTVLALPLSMTELEIEVLTHTFHYLKNLDHLPQLVFLDQNYKNFFQTHDGAIQIARTGYQNSNLPIFVNLEYAKNTPSPSYILSYLIHELLHQAGVGSHSLADQLAAKIAKHTELHHEELVLDHRDGWIAVNSFTNNALKDVDLIVSGTLGFTKLNLSKYDFYLECGLEQSNGIEVSNLHWIERPKKNKKGLEQMNIGAWIKVYCQKNNKDYVLEKFLNILATESDNNKLNAVYFIYEK